MKPLRVGLTSARLTVVLSHSAKESLIPRGWNRHYKFANALGSTSSPRTEDSSAAKSQPDRLHEQIKGKPHS